MTTALYERYSGQIYGFCLNRLGSREEAEDAVQTTFLNAFRGLARGVEPQAESAWLFKIAENVCRSRHRSSFRRRRVESPSDLEAIQDVVPGREPEQDELHGLERALEQMPESQRRAILLREWQGLSYHEIAVEMGLTQAAVETLIFRARRSLAQGLETVERVPLRRRVRRGVDAGSLIAAFKTFLSSAAAIKTAATVVAVTSATVVAVGPARHHHRTPVLTRPAGMVAKPHVLRSRAAASPRVVPAATPAPAARQTALPVAAHRPGAPAALRRHAHPATAAAIAVPRASQPVEPRASVPAPAATPAVPSSAPAEPRRDAPSGGSAPAAPTGGGDKGTAPTPTPGPRDGGGDGKTRPLPPTSGGSGESAPPEKPSGGRDKRTELVSKDSGASRAPAAPPSSGAPSGPDKSKKSGPSKAPQGSGSTRTGTLGPNKSRQIATRPDPQPAAPVTTTPTPTPVSNGGTVTTDTTTAYPAIKLTPDPKPAAEPARARGNERERASMRPRAHPAGPKAH